MDRGRASSIRPSIRCWKPSTIPRTSHPEFRASIVAAEITEFIPGAGPPPHKIPTLTRPSFQEPGEPDKRTGTASAPIWTLTHGVASVPTHNEFGAPVIGGQKPSAPLHAVPVLRGNPARTPYVTAARMPREDAADLVRHMSGRYRLTDALHRAGILG